MLKIFTKQQQATHASNRRSSDRRQSRKLKGQHLLKITYSILVLSLLLWGWQILKNPKTLPIESVQIKGSYSFITVKQIRKAIAPYVNAGFFNVDINGIHSSLLALPWVAGASITRIWPHQLNIRVIEQIPIAQWGHAALVNEAGHLFYPSVKTFPNGLPLLTGAQDQQKLILADFQRFNLILSAINLNVDKLTMSPRGAVQLSLSNGIKLILGNNDVQQRLQHFTNVYPKLFQDKAHLVEYVDMRYTNGMAVKWKNGEK